MAAPARLFLFLTQLKLARFLGFAPGAPGAPAFLGALLPLELKGLLGPGSHAGGAGLGGLTLPALGIPCGAGPPRAFDGGRIAQARKFPQHPLIDLRVAGFRAEDVLCGAKSIRVDPLREGGEEAAVEKDC